jgi:hypothetical protein
MYLVYLRMAISLKTEHKLIVTKTNKTLFFLSAIAQELHKDFG